MPIVCPQCSEKNADDALMCGMCGSVLRRISSSLPQASGPTAAPPVAGKAAPAVLPPRPEPPGQMPAPPPRPLPPGQTLAPPPELRAANLRRSQMRTDARRMASMSLEGEPAGFLLRFAAIFVDGIILFLGMMILGVIIVVILMVNAHGRSEIPESGPLAVAINGIFIIATVAYHAGLESSRMQGTLGKYICGIKVVDSTGERISLGLGIGRIFAKYLSAIICYIGFLMAAFNEDKRTLHDMITNTEVVKR